MGEGGGWESSRGEVTAEVSIDDGDVGDIAGSDDLVREFRPDRLDLIVSLSDLSISPLGSSAEFRGLSFFPEPGILDRRALKDLVESLVSDLLKDGKDCRPSGPAELLGRDAPPSLDGWLPIVLVCEVSQ